MRKYTTIILLLSVIVSHAQHAFFRGNNNYVAPIAVATSQANALDFDGIDDYVDCGINTSLNLRSSMTIELWIKPNQNMGNGKWDRLVNKDWYTGYFFGGKEGATNALAVALSGDLNAAVTPNNTIDIGVWQHVGFVFDDPANTIKIYKNGVLISTSTWNGTITGNPNSSLTLSQSSETFNGAMDDVRIWNVARTQTEIQTNMNTELAGTETGLKAYYLFNQGISSGNNTTITSVTDKTANVLNGTLNNFAKTGATSNFVVGKVSGSIVTNGLVLNLDASNSSSYSGTGTTWTDLSVSSNNGTLTNGATFNSANGGAMVFDGIDDRVQTNYNPTFTDFTVCVWYKDNGSSIYGRLVDNNYINGFWLGKNGTTPNQWGGGIKESPSPFGIYLTLPDSQWHFLTSVRSGTTHTIYGDGITNKISNTVSAAALSGTSIAIGEWSGGGTGQIFKGSIPQVLIYSRAITEAEIMQIFNATKGKYGL
jgi:hypothetical protein